MAWKDKAAVTIGVAALLTGGLWYLEPTPSPDRLREQVRQQQVDQLADSQDATNERHRDKGREGLDMENDTKNQSRVPDPKGPKVRIRP